MTFKESLTLTPGQQGTVVDTPAGRLGIGICYDIRFPELAMLYAQQGAQALIYPGGPLCDQRGVIMAKCAKVDCRGSFSVQGAAPKLFDQHEFHGNQHLVSIN
jgi:predicted amidohydrolase